MRKAPSTHFSLRKALTYSKIYLQMLRRKAEKNAASFFVGRYCPFTWGCRHHKAATIQYNVNNISLQANCRLWLHGSLQRMNSLKEPFLREWCPISTPLVQWRLLKTIFMEWRYLSWLWPWNANKKSSLSSVSRLTLILNYIIDQKQYFKSEMDLQTTHLAGKINFHIHKHLNAMAFSHSKK